MTKPTVIEAKEEFRRLTEEEVRAALDDPDPANPIAVEVARLIEGFTANFAAHVERLGYFPESIIHLKGRSPIETVAMELTTAAVRQAFAEGAR